MDSWREGARRGEKGEKQGQQSFHSFSHLALPFLAAVLAVIFPSPSLPLPLPGTPGGPTIPPRVAGRGSTARMCAWALFRRSTARSECRARRMDLRANGACTAGVFGGGGGVGGCGQQEEGKGSTRRGVWNIRRVDINFVRMSFVCFGMCFVCSSQVPFCRHRSVSRSHVGLRRSDGRVGHGHALQLRHPHPRVGLATRAQQQRLPPAHVPSYDGVSTGQRRHQRRGHARTRHAQSGHVGGPEGISVFWDGGIAGWKLQWYAQTQTRARVQWRYAGVRGGEQVHALVCMSEPVGS